METEIARLAEENRRLAERQAAAEQRLGQLAQFHAAVLQLHEASTPADVLTVIKEIVANLVGSEAMAIYGARADGTVELLDGIGGDEGAHAGAADPIVSIPLRLDGRCLGVIAIFALLPQKRGLEPSDHELFEILSTHAALALHRARRLA